MSPPHQSVSSTTSNSCAVCGSRHHGQHFGVLACRACSSFWRRSLVERKTYKCRANGTCDIGRDGMRNACRACRLKRCQEAGMKGDVPSAHIHEPIGDHFHSPTAVSAAAFPEFKPAVTNELGKYQLNYRNFCSAQRSLFIVENPRAIFSTPEFKPLKRSEHERMERGSIALLHTMLSESSQAYQSLPKQAKLLVIRHYSFQFGYLHRCYLSSQMFSTTGDPRMVVHWGYFMSSDTLDYFFEGTDPTEEHKNFVRPLMEKSVQSADLFRELQIQEIEMVAMTAITFYHVLADLDLLRADMKPLMDAVNNEFVYNVLQSFGLSNAGVRLGRIFGLLHHVSTRTTEMRESLTVARIFLMDLQPDVWNDLELPDDQNEVNVVGDRLLMPSGLE